MDEKERKKIEEWFSVCGRQMCEGVWQTQRELYVDCVLYGGGVVRCSDRKFGDMLMELGCEMKRVSSGLVYRVKEA